MRTALPSKWFRMYAEFATDPKVQMLSEADQRRFMMVLCLRCSNGDVTLHDEEVAFQLRISDDEWSRTKGVLTARKLIDDDNKPVAWEKRQYASDSSAERVSKHREKKKKERNGDVTLQSRPVEAETEKEADTSSLRSDGVQGKGTAAPVTPPSPPASPTAESKAGAKGSSLPDDWKLPKAWGEWALTERKDWTADTVRRQADLFRDHWRANANQRNAKKADWEATWRNWVRKAMSLPGDQGAERPQARASPHNIPPAGSPVYGTGTPLPAGVDLETVCEGLK